jgi:polyvinyl alcohol dehydrogenase (cytochrome)
LCHAGKLEKAMRKMTLAGHDVPIRGIPTQRSSALAATLRGGALGAVVAIAMLVPGMETARAQATTDLRLFEQHCTACHGNPAGPKNAADAIALRKMSPEAVYAALQKAPHLAAAPGQAKAPTDEEKRLIAGYLGGRKVNAAKLTDAKLMPNQCRTNPAINPAASPAWNGWGADSGNTRFQTAKAAGLTPEQVPQLKLKWAFGFPAAEIMWGQPTIVSGRVFIGVDTGAVYSIDAATGCVYWSYQADAGVRNAISLAAVKGAAGQFGAYFGDVKGNVYGVDAATGKQLWKVKVEDVPVARITGSPTFYQDRLYVPVSSSEERAAGLSATYPCCLFRGSVVALDAATGKQIWKTYIIPDAPRPTTKTSKGVQQYGPAGGAVWNTPTIDPARHVIYVGTGDSYNPPIPKTTDAVVAMDMDSGKILWSAQDTANDAWLFSCNGQSVSENCPKDLGPDFDFGASPILRTLPGGQRILVAGQKSGIVWGHDPDKQGQVVWKNQLVEKVAIGIITFGGAADEQNAYFGLRTGGIAALDLKTGEKKWLTPIPVSQTPGLGGGETAALTAIPGAIFSSGQDGVLRAFATADGHALWEYNTNREFPSVNGVAAHGGSMGAPGPTVAGGMVFVGSGYTFGNGAIGNVLLAFSPQ